MFVDVQPRTRLLCAAALIGGERGGNGLWNKAGDFQRLRQIFLILDKFANYRLRYICVYDRIEALKKMHASFLGAWDPGPGARECICEYEYSQIFNKKMGAGYGAG